MKNIYISAFAILLIGLAGCQQEDASLGYNDRLDARLNELLQENANNGLNDYILPNSDDFGKIPQDPKNPITTSKVELGKMLFHETAIATNAKNTAGEGTYSCASCHHAQGGFQACLPQGIGDGGVGFGFTGEERIANNIYSEEDIDVQPVRTPSVLNIGYQSAVLWNGQFGAKGPNVGTESFWKEGDDEPTSANFLGFEGTETQAIAGLKVHRLIIDEAFVNKYPEYKTMFNNAFPDFSESERYSRITGGLAIAAYERTVLSSQAPFQDWLKGDNHALTEEQKIGAILFFGRSGCVKCHNGPALSSMNFYALGMNDLHEGASGEVHNVDPNHGAHLGRGGFTHRNYDLFKFKVPQLYNLKSSPFYGHGSSFRSVEDIVQYKNAATPENPKVEETYLAKEFKPLHLSEVEVTHIADFVKNSLYDDNLMRYVPQSLPSGNCFPNNDDSSQSDLGCQ